MKGIVRGRIIDERKIPLQDVKICIDQRDVKFRQRFSDIYWSDSDGKFEIPLEIGLISNISINAIEFRSSVPSLPSTLDKRPAILHGRCFRCLEISDKDLTKGLLDLRDIILGYPVAKIFGKIFTSEGKLFVKGSVSLHAANIKGYGMDAKISDATGRFLLEGLDPTDVFTITVRLEQFSDDKFWTTWTFPAVKSNVKPLRLVLEDKYKEVTRIPEL